MLSLTRYGDESWRDAVKRYAKAFEVEGDVLEYYDECIADGEWPAIAALDALDEWELLDRLEVIQA